MTTQRQTTQTVTREEIDLDVMLEEAALAVQRVNAAGKDTRALSPKEREATLAGLSRALGLNPLVNGVRFLTLQGGEVLYVTRQATDQIAARLRLNRETLVGPEVRDVAGTKMVFCQVRVTAPDKRSEVATATLPLRDPANDLMKCETKAKRRATLSLAGLGLLTEEETETIPGAAPTTPATIEVFRADVKDCGTLREILIAWQTWAADLARDGAAEDARAIVCQWIADTHDVIVATEVQTLLSNAATVPAAYCALYDALTAAGTTDAAAQAWHGRGALDGWYATAARQMAGRDLKGRGLGRAQVLATLDAPPPPDGTDGPSGPRSAANDTATAEGSAAPSSGTDGPVALAAPDAWRLSAAGITAHVAEIGNIPRLANSARRNLAAIVEPLRTHAVHVYAGRLQALSHDGTSTLTWEACVERAGTWLREGPKDAAAPQRRKDKAA